MNLEVNLGGMQLSSCEEVAGPPSPAVGVPATGRRVLPGPGGGPVPRLSWHDYDRNMLGI